MRIATYNVEWFTDLFDDQGALLEDNGWSGRQGVTRAAQIAALGRVFKALDADAIMIIEAPDVSRDRNGAAALRNFAARFGLRARDVLMGFANETQQEIMLMFDPDTLTATHDPRGEATGKRGARGAPRFDGVFRFDVDIDASPELISWSKPPLEIAARTAAGHSFRMIGVHAKSKAPHGAQNPAGSMRLSIESRRKQLAQCIWLRQRIEQHLAAGEDIIVLGDLNDGPGLDDYEKLFGRSSVEIVMGEDGNETLYDPHAAMALGQRIGVVPVTARFRIPPTGRFLSVLLDYIMVSRHLRDRDPRWQIWHPFDDPACYFEPELREALLTASDHFPVTLDIDL